MKKWVCPKCRRQGETEEEVVMKICKVCVCEMVHNKIQGDGNG